MQSTVGRPRQILYRSFAILVAAFTFFAGIVDGQPQANAYVAGSDDKVTVLSLKSTYSTMELTFDQPITPAEASAIRLRHDTSETAATEPRIDSEYSHEMACGNSVNFIDGNGTFSVAYHCGSVRALPWGFKLSERNRATVVGPVNERGLSWWRNGVFAGQNAPHIVPADYQFHGTMSPVFARNRVEYQDYMTWRHNIGPGGTSSLTIAGRLQLTN